MERGRALAPGLDVRLELLLAATTAYGCISGARASVHRSRCCWRGRRTPLFFCAHFRGTAARGVGGAGVSGLDGRRCDCLLGRGVAREYSMFWLYLGRLLVLPQGAGGASQRSPVSTHVQYACMIVYVFVCLCIHVCVHAHAHTHTCTRTHAHTRKHRSSSCCCGSARCVPSGSLCIRPVSCRHLSVARRCSPHRETTLDCGVVVWGVLFSGAVGLIQGPAAII